MTTTYAELMAKLAFAGGNQILLKAVEVAPPKVRRGRPRKPPRVVIRKDRGGERGMAYLAGDGPKRSLGITGDNMAAAEVSATVSRITAEAAALGIYAPAQVPLKVVFEEYKKSTNPGHKGTVDQVRDHEQMKRRLDRVLSKFDEWVGAGGTKIGDVKPRLCRMYDEWLQTQPAHPRGKGKRTLTVGSSRMDLGFARAALNWYIFDQALSITSKFWIPLRPEPRQNWLTRRQIARLLWVCYRGYTWDNLSKSWVTEVAVDPTSGQTIKRRKVSEDFQDPGIRESFRQAARAVLVLYYTGTRSTKACNLVWDESRYKGWIDPDRGLIKRSGVLLSNNSNSKRKPKPAGTAILPAALRHLARLWRKQDAKVGLLVGNTHVFRKADGSAHDAGSLLRLMKQVGSRCDLEDLIVHEFRHSTVTNCLRAGCSISDTAAFVDMSEEMVRTTYGHLAEEATLAGALAMGDRKHQPRFSSRDLAADKPRNLLTPAEAMASRTRIGQRGGLAFFDEGPTPALMPVRRRRRKPEEPLSSSNCITGTGCSA